MNHSLTENKTYNRMESLTSVFSSLQASPPVFCPEGRTYDLSSIISIISEAQKFVYVSVMEYFPTSRFTHPERYSFHPETISTA